ncbi:LIM/homeobox protein Awh isoform X1 [Cylas formicarius]|uniref:LIM/homeobox protein Awh isoform X1 n=1 Tax=Cylas formicarius TaxID=197179 RepID=UPI0029585AEE|nr:LIM/homeobox protein Awh isoform X1 [Cylas formicarius]
MDVCAATAKDLDGCRIEEREMKTEFRLCAACGDPISDKFLLEVSGRSWHSRCLRCCVCQLQLDRQPSCFIRDRAIYCKIDYAKSFGAKCSVCMRGISSSDWVRKARDHVYHLACFACAACHRQLSTGEEFALHEDRVLCKAHYLETLDGGTTSSDGKNMQRVTDHRALAPFSSPWRRHGNVSVRKQFFRVADGCDAEGYHKNKAKRVRTTFTEEQLQVLQANFQLDSNPDGQDLERIAQITGLSKRVTQVWFQNSRARQKKHMHTGKTKTQQLHTNRDDSGFGRHINLHLTYSFQHQSKSSIFSQPDSSLDELSQESALHCMQNEV